MNIDNRVNSHGKGLMNKEELKAAYFAALAELDLPAEDVVVSAGGACVMYGVREDTADIDVSIPVEVFKQVASGMEKYLTYFSIDGDTVAVLPLNDQVDLHPTPTGLRAEGFQTTLVEGVCCLTVDALLEQKLLLNREKDQADIVALKALVETQRQQTSWCPDCTSIGGACGASCAGAYEWYRA